MGDSTLTSGTYTTTSKNNTSWGILSEETTTGLTFAKGDTTLSSSTYTTENAIDTTWGIITESTTEGTTFTKDPPSRCSG